MQVYDHIIGDYFTVDKEKNLVYNDNYLFAPGLEVKGNSPFVQKIRKMAIEKGWKEVINYLAVKDNNMFTPNDYYGSVAYVVVDDKNTKIVNITNRWVSKKRWTDEEGLLLGLKNVFFKDKYTVKFSPTGEIEYGLRKENFEFKIDGVDVTDDDFLSVLERGEVLSIFRRRMRWNGKLSIIINKSTQWGYAGHMVYESADDRKFCDNRIVIKNIDELIVDVAVLEGVYRVRVDGFSKHKINLDAMSKKEIGGKERKRLFGPSRIGFKNKVTKLGSSTNLANYIQYNLEDGYIIYTEHTIIANAYNMEKKLPIKMWPVVNSMITRGNIAGVFMLG